MKFKSEISILCFALLVWAAEGEQSVWAAGRTGEEWCGGHYLPPPPPPCQDGLLALLALRAAV